ncbi:hypothetical protein [Amycolatopsis sp. RTGN1]|uniref:hypothetical protein n=1 Tax=Amycolatopsis ponsaeliensis TaxID=2992142 RepID=UPI00254E12E2|nr:hypothetical protein [Amycolatopsis sp. RTGN1]
MFHRLLPLGEIVTWTGRNLPAPEAKTELADSYMQYLQRTGRENRLLRILPPGEARLVAVLPFPTTSTTP